MYDFILYNGSFIQFYCCKKECINNENCTCKLKFPIDFYKLENKKIMKKICSYYLYQENIIDNGKYQTNK